MPKQNSFNNILPGGVAFALGDDATGDLYYRDATGIVARLPVGTNGNNLTVVSGIPAWASGSSPGGNAGGDLADTFPNPTIALNAVSFAKMQNVSTNTFLGRISATTGAIQSLTAANARTILGLGTVFSRDTGLGNGNVPILDSGGKLDPGVIPSVSLTEFKGQVADQTARLAVTAEVNDWLVQTDNGRAYVLAALPASTNANWIDFGDRTIIAADIESGTFNQARLGSGTANAMSYLRGDQTWQPLPFTPLPSTDVTGTTQTAVANNTYEPNNAGLVTITLPATAAKGSIIRIVGVGAGGWRLAQGTGQSVVFGNLTTTAGNSGRMDSTHRRDAVTLYCNTANTQWTVISAIGNIDVI